MFKNPHESNLDNCFTNRNSRNKDFIGKSQTSLNKKKNNSFRHYYTNNYDLKLIQLENESKKNNKLKKKKSYKKNTNKNKQWY